MVDFAFWLFGSFGSSRVFFLRVRGGALCIPFFLRNSRGCCGVMQYAHLNQFIAWQVHCDQVTETNNLQ